MTAAAFYDALAPFYDLVYEDWDASIAYQARALTAIIKSEWPAATSVLDVSCGIGTQAIALALAGYEVRASDVSAAAVERAKREAAQRNACVTFEIADMRAAAAHRQGRLDVVISADNSVPHLLTDEDIRSAFSRFFACLEPGGGCLITVRDYEREPRGRNIVKPYGERRRDGKRYTLSQVWNFDGDHYDFTFSIVEQDIATGAARTHDFQSRYYAVSTAKLCELMTQAGFVDVKRLDGVFYQPVLVGTRPR